MVVEPREDVESPARGGGLVSFQALLLLVEADRSRTVESGRRETCHGPSPWPKHRLGSVGERRGANGRRRGGVPPDRPADRHSRSRRTRGDRPGGGAAGRVQRGHAIHGRDPYAGLPGPRRGTHRPRRARAAASPGQRLPTTCSASPSASHREACPPRPSSPKRHGTPSCCVASPTRRARAGRAPATSTSASRTDGSASRCCFGSGHGCRHSSRCPPPRPFGEGVTPGGPVGAFPSSPDGPPCGPRQPCPWSRSTTPGCSRRCRPDRLSTSGACTT